MLHGMRNRAGTGAWVEGAGPVHLSGAPGGAVECVCIMTKFFRPSII